MRYTIKIRPQVKYAHTNRSVSGMERGSFQNKEIAKREYLKAVRRANPLAREMTNKKLLSLMKIVKKR